MSADPRRAGPDPREGGEASDRRDPVPRSGETGEWRIGTASRLTGIPKATLLAWERRYGLPGPSRTTTGHRTYSPDDVATLLKVKGWLDEGFRIGEAVRMLAAERASPAPGSGAAGLARAREAILERLLAYDAAGADLIAGGLGPAPFEEVVEQLLLPLLREVGDRWHRGEASTAQEHHVTGWCRERLSAMRHQVAVDRPGAPVALLATPSGERHELGLLAIALHLQLRGWRVIWLGPDLPTADLCAAVIARRPRLVCLSVVASGSADGVREVARAVAAAAPDVLVYVGGSGAPSEVDAESPRIRFGATLADLDALGPGT